MADLKEILGKKRKEKDGDDVKKEAKMGVLKDLRGLASGMMKDGMKATVMAKDKAGLEQGLEKAKDVVGEMPEKEDDEMIEDLEEERGRDLDSDDEEGESPEHKAKVMAENCDPEDIDKMIAALEAKKREKMMEE